MMATSPGPLGGLRGLRAARDVLSNLGTTVLAEQVSLRKAFEQFDEADELQKEGSRDQVARLCERLTRIAAGFKAANVPRTLRP